MKHLSFSAMSAERDLRNCALEFNQYFSCSVIEIDRKRNVISYKLTFQPSREFNPLRWAIHHFLQESEVHRYRNNRSLRDAAATSDQKVKFHCLYFLFNRKKELVIEQGNIQSIAG